MQTTFSFADYKKKIPFFQEILQTIASQLSADEFYFPDATVEKARKELEKIFGQYVMSYKAEVFRKNALLDSHLCANYQGATLTKEQMTLLTFYETQLRQRNVRFVVYQKPLKKITIQESPFYQ